MIKNESAALDNCPLCQQAGGERQRYPAIADAKSSLKFEGIQICGNCGLGYAIPRPSQEQLDAYYSGGGYWHEVVRHNPAQVAHERNQCRHRVAVALPYLAKNGSLRVLDLGAGHGWTADALAELLPGRNLQFDFIEPDDQLSAAILARRYPFSVARRQGLSTLSETYDLIFLNHVLEHVAEPVEFLASLQSYLIPGGVLYIETPHADFRFKADVFPHTLFFTPASIERVFTRAGLVVKHCETFGRWPLRHPGVISRLPRAAFRAAVALKTKSLQNFFDDKIWDYSQRTDGIWLRSVVCKPSGASPAG